MSNGEPILWNCVMPWNPLNPLQAPVWWNPLGGVPHWPPQISTPVKPWHPPVAPAVPKPWEPPKAPEVTLDDVMKKLKEIEAMLEMPKKGSGYDIRAGF